MDVLPERIKEKIRVCGVTECWLWTGSTSGHDKPYGRVWWKGAMNQAHRVVYLLMVGGPIRSRDLDHTCENRLCVNPKHLEKVTHRENCKRIYKRRRTVY